MATTLTWPSSIIEPEYPLAETPEDVVIRSTMEDGTIKTRPRFTRNRMTYELSWSSMPEDQKQALETFLRITTKNGSKIFNWTHPSSGKQIEVRFSEMPKFSLKVKSYWQVTVKLQEV